MGSRICQIENRDYTPGEVLGTFLREALKMIGIERPDQQIQAMMITTGHLTRPFVENVREAYKIIGLPRGRAYLQEHDESLLLPCAEPEAGGSGAVKSVCFPER